MASILEVRPWCEDRWLRPGRASSVWLIADLGIGAFQQRSSLRTWTYRILVNRAKTRGVRHARSIPVSSLRPTDDDYRPTVDPARFWGPDDRYPGHWRSQPQAWPSPEDDALAAETR